MVSIDFFIVFVQTLIIFFIIARKKKWINSAGGIYTGQVLMHDLAMKDKQRALGVCDGKSGTNHQRR